MRSAARNLALAGALALVAVGMFFRLYHLDRKVFWEDEIFGTVLALGYTEAEIVRAAPNFRNAADLQRYFAPPASSEGVDWAATIRSFASDDPQHPPLYYLASRLWIEAFGSSVASIRALPALFGILMLPCAYLLVFELFGSTRISVGAVVLIALSPFHVLYAQEAREYSLWAVLTILSSFALLRAVRLGTFGTWSTYAFAIVASIYVYPISALVIAGHGVFCWIVGRRSGIRSWLPWLICATISALAFAPWLNAIIHSSGVGRGMVGILNAKPSALEVIVTWLRNLREIFIDFGPFRFGAIRSTPVNAALTVATTVLVVVAIVRLLVRAPRRSSDFVVFALCLPSLVLVGHDLLLSGHVAWQSRYFTPFYLGIEIAVAFLLCAHSDGAESKASKVLRRVTFLGLASAGFASCAIASQADTWWNKDYEQNRYVAELVNASVLPVVISDFGSDRTFGLGYYLDPRVGLRLNISCAQCAMARPKFKNLVRNVDGYRDVFVLGASPRLARDVVVRERQSSQQRFHPIDIRVYANSQSGLSLFQAI